MFKEWVVDPFFIRCVAAIFALGVLTNVAARADDAVPEPTMAQRIACTPDAFRLCSNDIPDIARVRACMRANKANLSARCRAMFRS